jgi:hypothetical protein
MDAEVNKAFWLVKGLDLEGESKRSCLYKNACHYFGNFPFGEVSLNDFGNAITVTEHADVNGNKRGSPHASPGLLLEELDRRGESTRPEFRSHWFSRLKCPKAIKV